MSREAYKKINTPSKPLIFFRLLEPDLFGKFLLHELSQPHPQPCEFPTYTTSCSRNCHRSTAHCMNNILLLVPSSHIMRKREQLVTNHPFPIAHYFVNLNHAVFHLHLFPARALAHSSCSSDTAACTSVIPISHLGTLFQFCYIPFRLGHHSHYKIQTYHGFIQQYNAVPFHSLFYCFTFTFLISTSAEALN